MRVMGPVHEDAFIFTIEIVNADGKSLEAVAGAENIFAARAAFDVLLNSNNERTRLRIGQVGRIMTVQVGKMA